MNKIDLDFCDKLDPLYETYDAPNKLIRSTNEIYIKDFEAPQLVWIDGALYVLEYLDTVDAEC